VRENTSDTHATRFAKVTARRACRTCRDIYQDRILNIAVRRSRCLCLCVLTHVRARTRYVHVCVRVWVCTCVGVSVRARSKRNNRDLPSDKSGMAIERAPMQARVIRRSLFGEFTRPEWLNFGTCRRVIAVG